MTSAAGAPDNPAGGRTALVTVAIAPEELGTLIARGRTADILALGSDRVLKLLDSGYPVTDVAREAEANLAVAASGIRAPQLHALARVGERHGLVFERVAGASLLEGVDRTPAAMDVIAEQLASLHAQIHAHHAPTLRPLKEYLAHAIRRAPLAEAIRAEALARLAQLPSGDRLCHMDFHPYQVIRQHDEVLIVDWLTACQGAPAADVARTALLLTVARIDDPALAWLNQGLYRSALAHRYVNHYCALTGVTVSEIERWFYPLAAARRAEVSDDDPAMLAFLETSVNNSDAQPYMGAIT